jgi:predicted nucleic acid-binding Zn ribbon protein
MLGHSHRFLVNMRGAKLCRRMSMPVTPVRCNLKNINHLAKTHCAPVQPVKGAVRRVVQPVGIAFKGSGWHINDYRTTPKESGSANDVTAAAPVTTSSDAASPSATPAPASPPVAPTPAPAASKSTDA